MNAIRDQVPPVICISLPEQHERRARMRAQFEAAGIPLRFFGALRIAGDVESYPSSYAAGQRLRRYAMHLCPGEIGCYLSHREVWRQLAASNDAAWCVLEDDVILGDEFAQTIAALYRLRSEWDVVRLTQPQRKDFHVLKPLHGATQLIAFSKQPTGAVGYLVTRKAASVLYSFTEHDGSPLGASAADAGSLPRRSYT
jgi:glycosyl transferase family 25